MEAMGMSPVISVIIPTYNRAGTLMQAIDSVLAQQDVASFEVLVMDDGSTDNTPEMMAQAEDPRIQYVRLFHQGACAARNAGIRRARGKYIAFQDSDDIWNPVKLSTQMRVLEETGADVVFHAYQFHDRSTGYEGRYPEITVPEGFVTTEQLLKKNLMSTQMVFGKTECFRKVSFNAKYPRFQDWDLAIRLSHVYKLYYAAEVMADVYMQEDSISAKPELALEALNLMIWENLEDLAASHGAYESMMEKYAYYAMQNGNRELTAKIREVAILTENVKHLGADNQILFQKCENLDRQYQEQMKLIDRTSHDRIVKLEKDYQKLDGEYQNALRIIEEMKNSTAWKLTAPLRRGGALVKGNREKK
ncbi:MAG: glycosyltransferase family 2 protein [Clostridia bacterium]|nr:glycosyltransferase family 2 protein [Clostridia bacterium]